MFKTLQNTAKIELTIVPDGPILVRAQTVGIDPGMADMEFQRTRRDGKNTVFLAGSGLKGVLRSHSERLLRSVGRFACDPTQTRPDPRRPGDRTCGQQREQIRDRDHPHDGQCSACFTFGSLKLAGRFRIGDAYPPKELEEITNLTEVRTGVGIDRKSQAASHGVLYDTEVVVSGGFHTRISGENFSLWQLALILAALQDLDRGLVRIGGCKARGMGNVRLETWNVELGFLDDQTGKLTGARPDSPENSYGLPPTDMIAAPPQGEEGRRGLFRTVAYEGDSVEALADALIAGPLQTYFRGGR